MANDFGKHNGESRISYRGRKFLRYVLYEAAILLIGKNLKAVYEYYLTLKGNPLEKMQFVIAVACKILRVFYTILKKGVDYDSGKLIGISGGRRFRQHSKREKEKTQTGNALPRLD